MASLQPSLDWDKAQSRAKELLHGLSNDEKATLCSGTGWKQGPCLGNIAAVPSIHFPGLFLQDGPNGLRWADRATAPPSQLNTASTFNRDLMRRRGEMMGAEARGKGINVLLAPCMNLARVPEGGRNFESSGADPYLQGEVAYHTVKGIQSKGVQACAKHYICNEQEHFRQSSSSNVDDATLHSIYLHPFLRSIQADVASVMTSYNQVNGVYTSESKHLLEHVLKDELGFKGYTQSDWWAQKTNIPSAAAGLDMTMPGEPAWGDWNNRFFGKTLVEVVESGQLSQERLDDMATRILTSWLLLGQDKNYPEPNLWCWDHQDPRNKHVDVAADHAKLCREIAEASIVLLKNDDGILPLRGSDDLRSIAVLGQGAGDSRDGPSLSGEGGQVEHYIFENGAHLTVIGNRPGWDDYVEQSIDGGVPLDENDPIGSTGVAAMGWGSGTALHPYLISPLSAIQHEAITQRIAVDWMLDNSPSAIKLAQLKAKRAQVVIVCVSAPSGEGYINVKGHRGDRKHLEAWHRGTELIKAVAEVNPNTVVVCNTAGPILMEEWIAKVKAVVWCGLPGQEAGSSLASVLFGHHNPSGRLPYTIAKNRHDYGVELVTNSQHPITPIDYQEGELFDYRRFQAFNIEPRYCFGHGLSYTRFAYSNFVVDPESSSDKFEGKSNPSSASLSEALHRPILKIRFDIKNEGLMKGTEVPQLYVHFPETKHYVLRNFETVELEAGETKHVEMSLSNYSLSRWSKDSGWARPSANCTLMVGASAEDVRWSTTF